MWLLADTNFYPLPVSWPPDQHDAVYVHHVTVEPELSVPFSRTVPSQATRRLGRRSDRFPRPLTNSPLWFFLSKEFFLLCLFVAAKFVSRRISRQADAQLTSHNTRLRLRIFARQSTVTAPAGGAPVSRYCQSAASSLRATATMPILRIRELPPAKRR